MRPSLFSATAMTYHPNITGIFTVLALFAAWVAAIFFQGLDVRALLYAQFFLLTAALITFYQLPAATIKFPSSSLVLVLALFWLWILIAPNWSLSPYISRQHVWGMGLLPASFFIYQFSRLKDKHWDYFLYAVIATGCILSLHAIYQVSFSAHRASSVFYNPNSFAALLNLITLAGSALLLIHILQSSSRKQLALIALAIFIMAYAIGLTQSRGAIISLFLALAILIVSTRGSVPARPSLALLALIAFAILMSNLHPAGGIFSELQTLGDPVTAGAARFYIWESSWEMIKASPWLGMGAGMFWLVYPQYRSPLDLDAGFYVHNDYLQVWLENGLPALILLCLLLCLVLVYYLRRLKIETNPYRRIELAGIFSGLLAISFHSLFTFNFYILSIVVLSGIFLARFHQLCTHDSARLVTINIKVKPFIFKTLVIIAFIISASLLAREWLAEHYRKQAQSLISKGNYVVADNFLRKADAMHSSEGIYLTRVNMLIKLLQQTPSSATGTRQILFDTALSVLEQSESLNSHRSNLFLLKGMLYAENPEFSHEQGYELAEKAFRKSLQINPRQYRARYALALLYASHGHLQQASKVLDEGLSEYLLKKVANPVPYLELALRLKHDAGDSAGVNHLANLIRGRMPARAEPYTLDEIINNIVNSNASDYNFDVYDDSPEPQVKM